jgi:hypothetical protein
VIDDSHDAAGQEVLMLDHPKKTRELISIWRRRWLEYQKHRVKKLKKQGRI